MKRLLSVSALLPVVLCQMAFAGRAGGFFQTPEGPFLTAPDETVHDLAFDGGGAGEAQALLDRARGEHPEAFVVMRFRGMVTVSDSPLRVGSRTALVFLPGSGMVAAEGATATALVEVVEADTVSVVGRGLDRAILDGAGRVPVGIEVRQSVRVHLDHLLVRNCLGDGIGYTGRGDENRPIEEKWWQRKYAPAFYGQAGSVTRCRLEGNGGNGARISEVAQFMFVDNVVVGNGAAGVDIRSFNSVVGGCHFQDNATGIVQRSTDGVAVRNILRGNGVGISLAAESELNLVTYNRLLGNALGIAVAGRRNSIYHNELENPVPFRIGGTDNVVAAHRGVTADQASAPDNVYFQPPTTVHFHQGTVVAGMGRHDLEIEGGPGRIRTPFPPEDEAVDLAVVQAALDQARADHPEDVIVARLRGRFVATGEGAALRLPANTCVVLQGAILALSEGLDEIVKMDGEGFQSFSGGLVDANFLAGEGILATGSNIAVIDGVTVKHTVKNAISTKGQGRPGRPLFIRGCTVTNSRGRGIWVHVTADSHVIDNVASGNYTDGVDLDAFCFHSTALLNVCTANARSGVFVEEGINSTIVFANVLNRNHTGILVYNHSVEGNTGANVMACNEVRENTHFGVSIRGMRYPNKTSHGNFVFGNVFTGNLAAGARFGHPAARDNVISQNVLRGNQVEVDYIQQEPVLGFFTAPQE